jgi:hypothetical protein
MEEPGLDERERDKNGRIRLKNGNTLNKNLPVPIPEFSPLAKLETMREETGETSIAGVRRVARIIRPE